MGDQATNAVIAVLLGTVVAVVLLVPTAAYQYRLDGRLEPKDLAVLLSGAVYGLSLWTYTLLPMPVADTYRCQGRQLEPLGSIRTMFEDRPDQVAQFAQVALNVLLFVPLGYYLRVVLKRGVLTAGLVGLGVSLLIETTQTTGVWGLYDCAYRLFDVDDLMVNALGAAGGSLLAYVFLDRRDDATPPLPTTVTLGRRLVGLASDVVFSALLGGAAAAAYYGWGTSGPGGYDVVVRDGLLVGVPFVVQAVSVLAVGRTIGDHVTAVRAVDPSVPARLVLLAVGVAPAFALAHLAGWYAGLGLPVLLGVHVVAAWRTEQHRGLAHLAARLDLRIATEERMHR